MMSHFVYNAGLGALPLLRSSDPYFVFSGLIVIAVMLAPIIPGLIVWLRRRAHPIAPATAPIIDLATINDADRLTALAIKNMDWPTLLNDPALVIVCARTSSEIIGVAAGKITADGAAELIAAYVVPAWRRRYLGSELLDRLTNILRERGAPATEVQIDWRDDRGISFFAGQGWKQRVRVYSRSLLPPEPRPTGRRARLRAWVKRFQNEPIN
jgi:GNAT superfamily N-acetyltransferase